MVLRRQTVVDCDTSTLCQLGESKRSWTGSRGTEETGSRLEDPIVLSIKRSYKFKGEACKTGNGTD